MEKSIRNTFSFEAEPYVSPVRIAAAMIFAILGGILQIVSLFLEWIIILDFKMFSPIEAIDAFKKLGLEGYATQFTLFTVAIAMVAMAAVIGSIFRKQLRTMAITAIDVACCGYIWHILSKADQFGVLGGGFSCFRVGIVFVAIGFLFSFLADA